MISPLRSNFKMPALSLGYQHICRPRPSFSKSAARRCSVGLLAIDRRDTGTARQTDGHTDTVPLHRRSRLEAGSANNWTVWFENYSTVARLIGSLWLGRWTRNPTVVSSIPAAELSYNNLTQVVHTHVPLSPASTIWHRYKSRRYSGRLWQRCCLSAVHYAGRKNHTMAIDVKKRSNKN